MCNIWTHEHTFVWTGDSTSNAEPPSDLVCVCRALTMKQARELALKALYDAEERRQKQREQEAKYWMDE